MRQQSARSGLRLRVREGLAAFKRKLRRVATSAALPHAPASVSISSTRSVQVVKFSTRGNIPKMRNSCRLRS